jgi:hypothetical protein
LKTFLAILAILLVAGSVFADYKWRQWIAARRLQRHDPNHPAPYDR